MIYKYKKFLKKKKMQIISSLLFIMLMMMVQGFVLHDNMMLYKPNELQEKNNDNDKWIIDNKKRIVLDMLCDSGTSTKELSKVYEDSIVYGCTNEDISTRNILSNIIFFDFKELQEKGPKKFDIIQVHHDRLKKSPIQDEIYDYIDKHLYKYGYIIYCHENEKEIKEIKFLNKDYRVWIHPNRIYFSR